MAGKAIRLNSTGGFSLLEAIAITLLVGTVFAAAIAATLPLMELTRRDRVDITISDELGIGLERIKKDALSASSFTLPAGNGGNQLNLIITDFADINHPTHTIEYRFAATSGVFTNALTRRDTAIGTTAVIISGLSSTSPPVVYNNINVNNCFSVTLTKNDPEGRPVSKSASVLSRCSGA